MNVSVVSYKDVFGEKWVDQCDWSSHTQKKQKKWIRGAVYRLRNRATIDSSIFGGVSDKYYKLITPVKQIGKLDNFNGLVMKQIGGYFNPDAKIFSLSPQQCQLLHIKYEPGLEMFSSERNFERIIRKIPYNQEFCPDDLSTYPTWLFDGTIREMLVRLDDFVYVDDKDKKVLNIKTGKYYKILKKDYTIDALKTWDCWNIADITITPKFSLQTPNKKLVYKHDSKIIYDVLEYNVVANELHSKNVYVELLFNNSTKGCFTEDGCIGINTKQLKDKSFSDVFSISDNRNYQF